jgi:CheY-like chemotaxis protein
MKTLLFVEDDSDMLHFLTDLIEAEFPETKVKAFLKPSLATKYLESNHIDAVLSDLAMPDIDGVEFHQLLQKKNLLVKPFFFFTGNMQYKSKQVSKLEEEKLIEGVIEKPDNDRLIAMLGKWLS